MEAFFAWLLQNVAWDTLKKALPESNRRDLMIFRQALEDAQSALAAGDAVAAERAGKAVSALVKALKDVEELEALALGQRPEEDDEELRANLERRIARFIGADRAEDIHAEVDAGGAEASRS